MKGRSLLLALSALVLALACDDSKPPTGPLVPNGLSKSLSDGAHGDNADFFFLPPLVKLKKNNPNFELGTFNNTLQPRLFIEICELNTNSVPTDGTACVSGPPVKRFDPGEVILVNLPTDRKDLPKPFHHEEWWKGPHRNADGFYYVLWDTRQSALSLEKFYRIKVFIEGTGADPDFLLGFADVDPRDKHGPKWKYSRTRDLIEMVDDVELPIPFRVENVGGHCSSADHCVQETVNNGDGNPDTFQFVQVEGGLGAIAGARFPDGWLPAGGPQSVVVTIVEVPSDEFGDRSRTTPCHLGLPLQQFNKCFRFTTTPTLATDRNGNQFAEFVTVAVCYTLFRSEDPRAEFAEIWASGPNEDTRPLPDADDDGILGAGARTCQLGEGFAPESSNQFTRLASSGWRMLKVGFGGLFEVKTAYGVDLGLGGIVKRFSNIGPALSATIEAYPNPAGATHVLTLSSGVATASVRIMGNHRHSSDPLPDGINNVPVTFTVAANGTLSDGEGSGSEIVVRTTSLELEEGTADGVASIEWTPPTTPGTYRMTASGPTLNGPVQFSVIVPQSPPLALGALQGEWFNLADQDNNVWNLSFAVDGPEVFVTAVGRCENGEERSSCVWGEGINAYVTRWANRQEITFVADEGFATKAITVRYIDATHIRATTVTRFTDGSGRANYTTTETLQIAQ